MSLRSEREQFWDIQDLSMYLKVKAKTLYTMIPFIPHYRVGKLIRFRKEEIDSWMEKNRENCIPLKNQSRKVPSHLSVDKLIRKAIDRSMNDVYNPPHGKSDLIKGPTKEIRNGSI